MSKQDNQEKKKDLKFKVRVTFRVTTDQLTLLDKLCGGPKDRSEFIRNKVFQGGPGRPRRIVHVCDPQLIWHLRKIGTNLNQMAKVLNTHVKCGHEIDVALGVLQLGRISLQLERLLDVDKISEISARLSSGHGGQPGSEAAAKTRGPQG
jgi:hypothetical protein